jgi:LDH2 family malate/lactate/ureidoglycolate dehydrogenase
MKMKMKYESLYLYTYTVFIKMGCDEKDAHTAAKVLLSADLRGIDSHGVARLSGYVRLWRKNRINTNPSIRVVHETPSTATIDADNALGLVSAPYAMQIAIEKARVAGTGWVAVKGSNHFGIAGEHAMMALPENMIGIAMTNASPLVSPTFSTDRLLGTNPIAFAIPAKNEPAFVADFATTTAANGKLEILQRTGKDAPIGWIQDKDGAPTTNPFELSSGGALLPLGSDREHGSHKGYCLGSVVDILSAVLSGANYGPWVPPFVAFLNPPENPVGDGIGHFFGAMRIDAFRPADDFLNHMDNWIRTFRNANTVEGKDRVMIPGDPERETSEVRIVEGIPLNDQVIIDLKELALSMDIEFPSH